MADDIDAQAEREGQATRKARKWCPNHAKRRQTATTSRKGVNHFFGGDGRSVKFRPPVLNANYIPTRNTRY